MSLFDRFKAWGKRTFGKWSEYGTFRSIFTKFGFDAYKSEIVRSCVRPLAEFTSKAQATCSDKQLERMINFRPNIYMNGRAFLYKTRALLEMNNTVFIYINRDGGKVNGLYPVPYTEFEALEYMNGLFIRFYFANNQKFVLPWEELAVLRKDYLNSDIAGEDNTAILNTLEMLNVVNQGTANAIKATANLRGILKSTKAMLAPEAVKQQKDDFVKDYLNLENEGGIASLDSTQEFTPIKMEPFTASYEQLKEYRENVYRYFGVNEKIITSDMTSDEIESFYEMKVEPFLVDLSNELTSKIYAGKALAYDKNFIVFEANKLQFASLTKKISVFKEVVLNGGMTVNEWRLGCNMAPVEGGDELIRRLDVGTVDSDKEDDNGEEK